MVDEAVKNAIDEAAKTVKNLKWAELGRTKVRIEEQKIQEYQTEVRIGLESNATTINALSDYSLINPTARRESSNGLNSVKNPGSP